jgi:hypothetical protein
LSHLLKLIGYIGSITRLDLGPDNGNDRCIDVGVLRRLEAAKATVQVGDSWPKPGSDVKLKMMGLDNATGREVYKTEYGEVARLQTLCCLG